MKILKKLAAAAVLALGRARPGAGAKNIFALVPKNMNNPFFDQARDGCKKAGGRVGGKFVCEYIGPGEHGGGEEQVQIVKDLIARGVDGIAVAPVERRRHGQGAGAGQGRRHPGADLGHDLPAERTRTCASPMSAPTTTTSASTSPSSRRAQARGRHDLHPVRRRRGGQPQRAHAGHPRHARRQGSERQPPGERLTGQNGWTEVDGCPLYTDDDFPRRCSRWRTSWARTRTSTPSSRPAASRSSSRRPTASVVEKHKARMRHGARAGGRRHPAGADGPDEGRACRRPGRPAAVRDGLQDDVLPLRDHRRRRRPEDPTYTGLDVCTPETADTCIGS